MASSSTLTNCAAYLNSSYGFDIKRSVANNCEVNKCGFRAERCTITNCTANECPLDGIYAISGTTIFNFTAIGNGSHGINVADSCRIEGCNLRQNGWGGLGYGIYMSGSHNYAIKNVASDNTGGPFHADNPANNYMPTSLTAPDAANANVSW